MELVNLIDPSHAWSREYFMAKGHVQAPITCMIA
jgi:hypothetical protein